MLANSRHSVSTAHPHWYFKDEDQCWAPDPPLPSPLLLLELLCLFLVLSWCCSKPAPFLSSPQVVIFFSNCPSSMSSSHSITPVKSGTQKSSLFPAMLSHPTKTSYWPQDCKLTMSSSAIYFFFSFIHSWFLSGFNFRALSFFFFSLSSAILLKVKLADGLAGWLTGRLTATPPIGPRKEKNVCLRIMCVSFLFPHAVSLAVAGVAWNNKLSRVSSFLCR